MYLTYDKIITVKGKTDHMRTSTHIRAMLSWVTDTTSAAALSTEVPKTKGVPLSAAMQFSKAAIDGEQLYIPEFQNLVAAEDGIYNDNNMKVVLSAGRSVADNSKDVWQGIKDLVKGRETIPLTNQSAVIIKDVSEDINFKNWDEPNGTDSIDGDERWFPYENKTIFFLDLLDSLPRLRLSDDHLKAVLWVMKECGTPNVPSFYKLRKVQDRLRRGHLRTEEHTTVTGDKFFMNNPLDIIRLVS